MIRNRFRLTPMLRERLCGKGEMPSLHADKIFLIGLKLRELALLLLTKRLHIVEIRKRILVYGNSACLERELKDQNEQVEDLTQLAEDWLNILELLRDNPAPKPEELSKPLRAVLRSLGIQISTGLVSSK